METTIDQMPLYVFFTKIGRVYHEAFDDPSGGFQAAKTRCGRKFSRADAERVYHSAPTSGFPNDYRMCKDCMSKR